MTETVHNEPAAVSRVPFARTLRSVIGYAIITAVLLISPLFVFLPAALFFCGLRHGRRVALIALPIGALLAALLAVPAAHQTSAAAANMTLGYLVALILGVGLPSLFVLPMVQRGEAFVRVLLTSIVLSILGLGATEVLVRTRART